MKSYLITTGTLFGLITLAHIWRIVGHEPHLATEPSYVLVTVVAAAMSLWAFGLLRLSTRRDK